MTKRQKFTPATIDSLREGTISDPETDGLSIEAKGRKTVWRYRRRVSGSTTIVKMTLGAWPGLTIDAARRWAHDLNQACEAGRDPREASAPAMTVGRAHALYMTAVREGKTNRKRRLPKPRTVSDKLAIYNLDIAGLADRPIAEIEEADLVRLVVEKGKKAPVRANRLGAELMTFFGWCASLNGMEVGLGSNPAGRLAQVRNPEAARRRVLSRDEIVAMLAGLAVEPRLNQRGILLLLLSWRRISEVVGAHTRELQPDGSWVVPIENSKNHEHILVELGPWGQSLLQEAGEGWLVPMRSGERPTRNSWYKVVARLHKRMTERLGREVERWSPHDLRRTGRSNATPLGISFDTAERMLGHKRGGIAGVYDLYDARAEKAAGYLAWEAEIMAMVREAGVAEALRLPPSPVEDHQSGLEAA